MWTYAALKDADVLLNIADITAAAAALNAQTTSLSQPANMVNVSDVQAILLLAPTGDWLNISLLANSTFSATWPSAPTANDLAIYAAKLAMTLAQNSKITQINPAKWALFLTQVANLEAVGAISSVSQAEIVALADMIVPTWQPPVSEGDIQTARAQP